MRQITFEGQLPSVKHVLANLEWMTTNTKDFKSARAELKSQGKEWITLASSSSQAKEMLNYGVVERTSLPKQGPTVSLAGWLALSFRDGAVLAVEEVSDTDSGETAYWMCLINDGQVLSGSDIIIDDWETIESLSGSSVEALGADNLGYVGNVAHELEFAKSDEPYPALADVLVRTAVKKAKFSTAEGNRFTKLILLGTVFSLLIGGGAWYGIQTYVQSQEVADRQEKSRERQLNRARQEYQRILNEFGQMAHAGQTSNLLWDSVLSDTKTKIDGWLLQRISCQGTECTLIYSNSDLTLPRVLRDSIGSRCEKVIVDAEGIEASCTMSFPMVPIAEPGLGNNVSEAQIEQVLLSQGQINTLQEQFMTMARLAEGTAYAVNAPVAYPFNGSRFLPQAQRFQQGEWALAFPIDYFDTVSDFLGAYQGAALKEISLIWPSKIVQMRGMYVTGEETNNEG